MTAEGSGAAVDVLADVLRLLDAASPGPWETETTKSVGEYGDGGPCSRSGYMAAQMCDANGVVIFDSLNSQASVIDEDIGDESVYAWDAVAERDFNAVAAAVNFLRTHGAALLTRTAELEAERDALRGALSRQGDNMAFVLNNCDIPEVWCAKLNDELTEDRAVIAHTSAARAEAGSHG